MQEAQKPCEGCPALVVGRVVDRSRLRGEGERWRVTAGGCQARGRRRARGACSRSTKATP